MLSQIPLTNILSARASAVDVNGRGSQKVLPANNEAEFNFVDLPLKTFT